MAVVSWDERLGVLRARVGHAPRGVGVDGRASGLCVRTAALCIVGGRASRGGGAEAETIGGRVITGLTGGVTGFDAYRLDYEGGT